MATSDQYQTFALSRNPYQNEPFVNSKVSERLHKKLNKTLIFKANKNKEDEQLYEELKDLLDD